MKADYTITSAKAMISRNKGRFEGKMILIDFPGIKVLGAIDFLKTKGYGWKRTLPAKEKLNFAQTVKKASEAIKKFTKVMGGLID